MGQFFNSINEVRKNYKNFDAWEQEQADERAKKEYLVKTLDIPEDKIELTNKRAQTVIRATEMLDARSEDNCQNMEQLTGILSIIPSVAIPILQNPVIDWTAKKLSANKQKEVDKISEELNNISGKNLTQEELEAKIIRKSELIKEIDKITKKVRMNGPIVAIGLLLVSAIGFILWGNSKQKEASRIGRFQAKQNELKDINNFIVYTPEQIEKAKEIAKNIPDEKERNSISKLITELKDVIKDKKAYKEWVAKKDPKEIEKLKALNLSPEQLAKGQEDKELIVDAVKEINIKAEEYSENVENSFDTLSTLSWLIAIPVGIGINKILKLAKVNQKIRTVISPAIPILTSLGISLTGTLEEKKASRVGRYKARQDLLKNPARLMSFSDEEMEKAKNIKAPKQKQSFFAKLGDSFAFLGRYFKDKREYNKYKKTTQKENEKLQKALKQIETSDSQKADAKNLQKNVFRAFDEVDEMSQRYSEDVEAGTEIAKELGATAWTLGTMAALAVTSVQIFKGKFPITKLANWLANRTFNNQSGIKKAINSFYDVLKTQDKTTIHKFQESLVHGNVKRFLEQPENKVLKDAIEPLFEEFVKIGEKGVDTALNGTNKKGIGQIFKDLFNSHLKQTPIAKWTRNLLSQCSKLWTRNKIKSYIDTYKIAKTIKSGLKDSTKLKNIINTPDFNQKVEKFADELLGDISPEIKKELIDTIKKTPQEFNKIINGIDNMSISEIEKELNKFIKKIEEKLGTNITYKNYKTLFNTGIVGSIPILGTIFGIPYAFNAWLTNIQKKAGKIGIMKAMDKIDDPKVFAPEQQPIVTDEEKPEQPESHNLLGKFKK